VSKWHRLRDIGDRILFGSDFPNIPYPYHEAMTALTRLPGVDDDWLRGVFFDNAARLFAVSPDSVARPPRLKGVERLAAVESLQW
jgi:predicted TIM-barrel fold metal-dependent hydrolase